MRINLSVNERLVVANVVGAIGGTIEDIRNGISIIDKITLTDEEREKIGLSQQGTSIKWQDSEEVDAAEFDFSDAEYALLKGTMNRKSDWPMDKRITILFDKINRTEE